MLCAVQERAAAVSRAGSSFYREGTLGRRLPTILSVLAPLSAAIAWSPAAHAEELAQLEWGKPVRCIDKPGGGSVRVQCQQVAGGERCLVAPNQLAYDGGELDEVQPCSSNEPVEAYRDLLARNVRIVPALAEAPPGYARSEAGKAFQVKFDLLNRVYLGVGWVPTFQRKTPVPTPSNFPFGRAQAEAGIHVSALIPSSRARHDMRILEGAATFDDLEVSGVLFSYDYQHQHRRPAFWLSTFIGPPRVHPVPPVFGWGFRVLSVHDRPPSLRDRFDLEVSELHVSWNPWQSNDLYSHVRIEVGGDVGEHWLDRGMLAQGLDTGVWYAGLTSAVKSRLSLGEGGLHYMFTEFAYRRPTLLEGELLGESVDRLDASVAYEGIFLAINDQPISLRLAAQGSTRDDFEIDEQSVELRFVAGLRISFWAPPRVFEPMPEFEDP
jgi:hypothetical protein